MRNPLFHSAVALVAAGLTTAAFAAGEADVMPDRTADAPTTQPADVQVDVRSDHQADLHIDQRDDQAIPAAGEIQTPSQDQPREITTDPNRNAQPDRDATGAAGSIELNGQDATPHADPHAQPGSAGVRGEVEIGDPQHPTADVQSDPVRNEQMQTHQERTYRTDQADSRDRANGAAVRGDAEIDAEARTAGAVEDDAKLDHDTNRSDDWKWNSDKPHLKVRNPDKPHLAD